MKRPNLFIVGAARSGTTTLYWYLRRHPEVFMSPRKEPSFLGSDLSIPARVKNEKEYLALFQQARDERWRGEASVWYLASRAAPGEIRAFSPDAHIMMILRNPVDALYSFHGLRVFNGVENERNVEKAIGDGERKHPTLPLPGQSYCDHYRYAEQVERYLSLFPRDRVGIFLFDDLVRAPEAFRSSVETFLRIRSLPSLWPGKLHPHREPHSLLLQQLFAQAPIPLRVLVQWVPQRPRALLRDSLMRSNAEVSIQPPLRPTFRAMLQERFRLDIQRLSTLINRDLSGWLSTPSSAHAEPAP